MTGAIVVRHTLIITAGAGKSFNPAWEKR